APLGEGDRLALVRRVPVADQEVEQIHVEERVLAGACRPRRNGLVADLEVAEAAQCSRIVLVLVGVNGEGLRLRGDGLEQPGDIPLDGPRMRPTEPRLELAPATLLAGGHAAAATQLRVGEAVEEVAAAACREMKGARPVLAVLEADEAVEGERLSD